MEAPAAAEPAAGAASAPAPGRRARWKGDQRLLPLAKKLGARPISIEDPAGGLGPFFASLDALAAGAAQDDVVIAAIGNSIIASDKVVDRLRAGLTAVLGDGGRGVLLVDRMASHGPRTRTGIAPEGAWEPRHLGELDALPLPVGLTGVYHQARVDGAASWFRVRDEREVRLWWLDQVKGAGVQLRADGKVLHRAPGLGDGQSRRERVRLPEGTRALEVVAEKAGVTIQGVVLDAPAHGVVLDTLGVPSADANFWLKAHAQIFRAQLWERRPDLLLFVLGGNEVKRIQWGKSSRPAVEKNLGTLIRRAKAAAPAAGCLVVGPLDATDRDAPVDFEERRYLKPVNSIQRKVAAAEGCAYFDFYAAMGGEGALRRFHDSGLVHDDRVHPRGDGLELLGNLLARSVLDAWSLSEDSAGAEARR